MKLIFLPQNLTVEASAGDTILDAALAAGIELPHECGGNCACTTCHVQIRAGLANLSPMEDVEADRLQGAEDWSPASRLGCQALLLTGDVTAQVPDANGVF